MNDETDNRRTLLTAPVGPTMIRLALPMMLGIAAVVFFNLVDTFWVGRLGHGELAAMAFTFPVVMVISNLTIGLSIGATAAIARAIGEGRSDRIRRLTTHSLLLAVIIVVTVCAAGLLTLDPLFLALGADSEMLPLVREYMVPWYFGVGLLVIPMIGNGAIRATGDMKTPALVMVCAGLVNAALDPLLIFGAGPIEGMGLRGAAYATVASYLIAFVFMLWVLIRRERMITFEMPTVRAISESWRAILVVGLPAAGTNLLTPLAAGLVTRLVSQHGPSAVAAYGVGTRVESLSMIGVFAMTAAITTFVGQNHGAKKGERIVEALRFVSKASMVWGVGAALLLAALAGPLSHVFNEEATVVHQTQLYLRIVPISYAPFGVALLVASIFNALNMPLKATGLAALRLVGLAVPLAWLGSELYGLAGLFGGIVAANVVMGVVAFAMARRVVGLLAAELRAEQA